MPAALPRALRCAARALWLVLVLQPLALAQTEDLGDNPIPDLVAGLSFLTLSDEITGITATIASHSPQAADTELDTWKIPWKNDFDVGSSAGTLYFEGVLSYLRARDHLEFPVGDETLAITEKWQTFGGLVGVGWTFPIVAGLKLRPSIGLALSELRNDTDYSGPGSDELADQIDGVLVNFDAWAATRLASLSLLYERELGPTELRLQARHTWATTDVFSASSSFQEGEDSSRFFAVRADLEGDTPLRLSGGPIGWSLFASHVVLADIRKENLGFDRAYEVGGGLDLPFFEDLPGIGIGAGILFGPDIRGWTVGLSLAL